MSGHIPWAQARVEELKARAREQDGCEARHGERLWALVKAKAARRAAEAAPDCEPNQPL